MQFIFLVRSLFLNDNILVHKTNVCVWSGRERETERKSWGM